MKTKEIKDLSANDIREKINENKGTLAKIRMTHAVSPIENPLKIRTTRRTIARLITELNKREQSTKK